MGTNGDDEAGLAHMQPSPMPSTHGHGEERHRERGTVDFESVSFGYPTRSGEEEKRGGSIIHVECAEGGKIGDWFLRGHQ